MNPRLKLSLLSSLIAATLACASCGSGQQELHAAETSAMPASRLAPAQSGAPLSEPEVARRAFSPVVALGDGIEVAAESIVEKNDGREYEIDLAFPQLKGRLSPHAAKFNRTVRALVGREVRGFKESHVGPKPGWENLRDSFAGRYEVIHLGDDFASLRFTLYSYGRGGRTIQYHRVLNFDLKSGRVLKLADLFKPGMQHLQALAANCIADLKRRDEEEHRREVARVLREGKPANYAGSRKPDSWFLIAAGPEADNYRAWNLTGAGVLVSFASCSVAACADGEQEVLVPYSALAAILNRDGPAARLAARQPR